MQRNGLASQLSLLSSETPTASESSHSDGLESPASPTFEVSRSRLFSTPTGADAKGVGYQYNGHAKGAKGVTLTLTGQVKASASSPVGSLANLIPLQESVKRLLTIVTSGPRLPVSFGRFARDGSSGRMFVVSSTPNLDGSSAPFSGTWPTWGIALDGACGELPTLERCTSGSESSSSPDAWPTPTTRDHKDGSAKACRNVPANGLLGRVVHQWPTPHASCSTGPGSGPNKTGGENLQTAAGGALNPTWVEWLMGFPLGWTALEPSETPSSPSKRTRSLPKSPDSKA